MKSFLKRIIAKSGFEIVRTNKNSTKIKGGTGYISAKETILGAKREGLSVCDYVEKQWNKKGDTQKVIDEMASCGCFFKKHMHIVEIGAGTGRYLEKVLGRCNPSKYESYETAKDWAEWLQSQYPIISHDVDGVSLKETPSKSVDLTHAHGVFVYLPFLVSYQYFKEIIRITKIGGSVCFDIISEDCLDEPTVEKWLKSGQNYPCFISTEYVVSLFEQYGFGLSGTFMNRYGEGLSNYIVFKRKN